MSNSRISLHDASTSQFAKCIAAAGLAAAAMVTGCAEVDVVQGEEVPAVEPPVATLKSTPATLMRLKTATFLFEANKPASFTCKLDSGSEQPCTSPYVTPQLVDGSHVFSVTAKDEAGNAQAVPTTFQWEIDSTMAGVIFSTTPAAYTNSPSAIFEFSSDETVDFTCKLNGGTEVAATAMSDKSGRCQFSGLTDGEHSVTVTGSNEIGSESAAYEWVLDRVRPLVTKQSETKGSAAYALSFTISEYAAASSCTVSWSGGQNTGPCPLAQGNTSAQLVINRSLQYPACRDYTITVNATDRAGNTAQVPYTATFSFVNANGQACHMQAPEEPEQEE